MNAAALGARGTLLDTSVELWDQLFNTNVRGPFSLMQSFVKHSLDRERGGSIVNILSQQAHCRQSYLSCPIACKKGLAENRFWCKLGYAQALFALPQAPLLTSDLLGIPRVFAG